MVFAICYILLLSYLTFTPKNHIYMKKLHPPEDAGIFVSKFYKEITNVVNMSVFKQIEYLRKIS